MITCEWSIRPSPPRLLGALARPVARAVSASSAACETSSEAAPTSSVTPTFSRRQHRDALEVAERQRRVGLLGGRARRASGRPASSPRAARSAWRVFGRVERAGVEDRHRAALGVQRQRAAQRRALLLAVDLEGVGARLRAEHDATAGPDRRAARAGAGAAGALLAPWLGATAGDHRRGSSSPRCRAGARPARRARSGARAGRGSARRRRASSSLTFLAAPSRRAPERQASLRTSTIAAARARAPSRARAAGSRFASTGRSRGPSG